MKYLGELSLIENVEEGGVGNGIREAPNNCGLTHLVRVKCDHYLGMC